MTRPLLKRLLGVSLAGLLGAGLSGCTGKNPYFDPAKLNHTPDGFRNNPPHVPPRPLWDVITWMFEQKRDGLPRASQPGYVMPRAPVDVAWLKANGQAPTLTWIGHATLLLQVEGVNLLTDPHFSERASPFSFIGPRRKEPPALPLAELPHIDAVVISHDHYDHLDAPTVQALAAQPGGSPRFFVPLGMKAWFADLDILDVVELDWWEGADFKSLRMTLVPAVHFSARRLGNQNTTLWGGWTIRGRDLNFYFAGDTAQGPHFQEIGRRLGPFDLAALPIGAYEPRWFMKYDHINPEEAVRAHKYLGARQSVAMHWGTFQMTDEALDEPPKKLAQALDAEGISAAEFFLMALGETRHLRAPH